MNCYLFNITPINRKNNSTLFLEFYGGDITSLSVDVLLVSAFKSCFVPTPGTIFKAIKDRFGIEYGYELPKDAIELLPNLYEFPVKKNVAYFNRLWVIEITDLKNSQNHLSDFKKAIHTLKQLASIFDKKNLCHLEN